MMLLLLLLLLLMVMMMVSGRDAVVVVSGYRERGRLVIVFGRLGMTAAAAVLRRLGHRTTRMAVDQPDTRTHGRLFHLFLLLDPQEHRLSEETTLLVGRFRRSGRVVRRFFQPETRTTVESNVILYWNGHSPPPRVPSRYAKSSATTRKVPKTFIIIEFVRRAERFVLSFFFFIPTKNIPRFPTTEIREHRTDTARSC